MPPDQRGSTTVPPTYVNANRVWVDSRLRHEIGRRVEGRILQRLGARGARCVDIGTGRRGLGARCAVEQFGATSVTAVDLFPATVGRARMACADLADRVTFRVGDATALPLDDGSVDLVVDFHALHHIADWRAAVAEAARVLRPGGLLALTEMTARFVDAPWLRAVSRHPADRFGTDELVAELHRAGFEVPPGKLRRAAGDRWIQAVATRT